MREGDGGVEEDGGVVGVNRRHNGSPVGTPASAKERGGETCQDPDSMPHRSSM